MFQFFSRFPLKDKDRLSKWLCNMKRASWKPSGYSRICSDHFSDDCYKTSMRYVLKNDAIPTIFNFPPHLQKTTKSRRSIVKHKLPVSFKTYISGGVTMYSMVLYCFSKVLNFFALKISPNTISLKLNSSFFGIYIDKKTLNFICNLFFLPIELEY